MSHSDLIKDADAFFEVDPITRQIINKTPAKIVLMQKDHNSEKFTFKLPRYIEGHDMAQTARAQVHYINIDSATGAVSKDRYIFYDLAIDPDDESSVLCSWLISGIATKYSGKLTFILEFDCFENDELVYSWHSASYSGISIDETFTCDESQYVQYADIIAQWEQMLFDANDDGVTNINEARDVALDSIKNVKVSALGHINDTSDDALNNINEARDKALADVNNIIETSNRVKEELDHVNDASVDILNDIIETSNRVKEEIENKNSHSVDDDGNAFFNADVKSVDSGGIVHSLNDTAKGIVNKSEGVDIYLPDSAEAPLKELSIDTKGATIYVTGNNLFNPKNISCRFWTVVDRLDETGVTIVSGTTYDNDKGIIVEHHRKVWTNDYFYMLFDDVGVVQPDHGYTIIADVEVTKNYNTNTTSSIYNKIRFRTGKGLNCSSADVDVRSGKIAAYIPADKFGEDPTYPGIRILCLLWGKDMIFRNIILLPGDCRNNIPKYEDYRAQVITNVEDYKNFHTYYPTTRIINNADANMSVKYMADTKNYIDNKIAGLTALTLEG